MSIRKQSLIYLAVLLSIAGCTNPNACELPKPPASIMEEPEGDMWERMMLILNPSQNTQK